MSVKYILLEGNHEYRLLETSKRHLIHVSDIYCVHLVGVRVLT